MGGPLTEHDGANATPWWLEMQNGECILDYDTGDRTISIAAEFMECEPRDDGRAYLRFRTVPVANTLTVAPTEVRLLAIVGNTSYVLVLQVVEGAKDSLVLDSVPLSITQRRLREFPRTAYSLGPCTAVVHTAGRKWHGLVEFYVHDVSAQGVGFTIARGHRDRVAVGDYLRAPVTLATGERSWIDGEIQWLSSDGRGGLLTRRAPDWEKQSSGGAAGTSVPGQSTDLAFAIDGGHAAR
jgi:hypothetical protein